MASDYSSLSVGLRGFGFLMFEYRRLRALRALTSGYLLSSCRTQHSARYARRFFAKSRYPVKKGKASKKLTSEKH